jgi:hypothetical protein
LIDKEDVMEHSESDPQLRTIQQLLSDAGNPELDPDAPELGGFTVELAGHGAPGVGPYRVIAAGEGPVGDELDPYVLALQAAGHVTNTYWAERYVEAWPPSAVPALREEIAEASRWAGKALGDFAWQYQDQLAECSPYDQYQLLARAVISYLVGNGFARTAPVAWERYISAEIRLPYLADLRGGLQESVERAARMRRSMLGPSQ